MYRFAKDQSVVNVAGAKIGGQPGENPTALCGTIFYQGQRIVEDEERGRFDERRAEELISEQSALSEDTGNPAVLHIYARTSAAFQRYLDFVDALWSGPIILDSADPSTRKYMARLVSEIGYADKSIYNSVSLGMTQDEEEVLSESEIDSAIVLAYNPADSSVEGTIRALKEGGPGQKTGLIDRARSCGIKNVLIDPGVMPLGDGAGRALRITVVAKSKFGLPVGSGIHNAVSSWSWLKEKDAQTRRCCDSASAAFQTLAGGDFVLYGPIENAPFVFPIAAMADIMTLEGVRDLDIWPSPTHPINRLI